MALQAEDLARFTTCTLDSMEQRFGQRDGGNGRNRRGTQAVLAGLVRDVRRRGNRGGFVAIEDHTGRCEVSVFDEAWTLYADLLNKDEIIVVEAQVAPDRFSSGLRINVQKIMSLGQAKAHFARGVQISLTGPVEGICALLKSTFLPYREGSGQVWLDYRNARARARIELGPDWSVSPCEELVAALGELGAVRDARLIY